MTPSPRSLQPLRLMVEIGNQTTGRCATAVARCGRKPLAPLRLRHAFVDSYRQIAAPPNPPQAVRSGAVGAGDRALFCAGALAKASADLSRFFEGADVDRSRLPAVLKIPEEGSGRRAHAERPRVALLVRRYPSGLHPIGFSDNGAGVPIAPADISSLLHHQGQVTASAAASRAGSSRSRPIAIRPRCPKAAPCSGILIEDLPRLHARLPPDFWHGYSFPKCAGA